MTDENDRIGLSAGTADGQSVRLAGGLSGQTGWRRTAAKTFAFFWLAAMAVVLVVVVGNLSR